MAYFGMDGFITLRTFTLHLTKEHFIQQAIAE